MHLLLRAQNATTELESAPTPSVRRGGCPELSPVAPSCCMTLHYHVTFRSSRDRHALNIQRLACAYHARVLLMCTVFVCDVMRIAQA